MFDRVRETDQSQEANHRLHSEAVTHLCTQPKKHDIKNDIKYDAQHTGHVIKKGFEEAGNKIKEFFQQHHHHHKK